MKAAFRLQSGGVVAGKEHLLDGVVLFRRAGEQPPEARPA
jgi:hypothetical protein